MNIREQVLPGRGTTFRMQYAGAGRGTTAALPRLKEMLERSSMTAIEIAVIDPAPGKALARAREAATLGIRARPVEMTAQQAMLDEPSDVLLVVAIDDPHAIAQLLLLAADHARAVVVNVFVQLPSGKLIAIRGALALDDRDGKIAAAAFFATLDRVTVRASSSKVWGATAPPANVLLEPTMRDWFMASTDRAFEMAAGLRVDGAPLEVTFDGVDTLPLFIRDSREGWADTATLAHEVRSQRTIAIDRGTAFVIAEVGDDALQLTNGKLRAVDRELRIDGVEPVDAVKYAEADGRAEAAKRAAEEAVARAERARLTAVNPVHVTD